jgi:pyridoxal phosphate enzyme (YggS family)
MSTIQENLFKLRQTILALEEKYQRRPHSVSLLAMSKGQPIEKLEQAIAAGQRSFGENYLQEALEKMESLREADVEWHFTGLLQSNKTRLIAERFAWVHTLTSLKQAERLNEQRPLGLPPLNLCMEVNVSGQASKAGLKEIEEVLVLAKSCLALPRLRLRGLMAIPRPTFTLREQRAELHRLVQIQEQLAHEGIPLDTLSMGMTDDLEAAIAEGATTIRIGRGIFGPRT